MWTLDIVKTDLKDFFGPRRTSTTSMLNLNCSSETTTEKFSWSKLSHWENHIESDFNQFMRLRNRLAIVAEKIGREENVSPVLILTMAEDRD